jgi:hypothetical protein
MLQNLFAGAQLSHDGNFSAVSREHVEALHKALYAGSDVNNPGPAPGQGFPLRVESLEGQMKNLSYSMEEIKLFRMIGKVPATNTVEEFNRLLAYDTQGQDGYATGGFMGEGDLPDEEDSTYERATVLMKFLGQTRRVTHVADTIKSANGDVIAQQTSDGTMSLLRILEQALFYGDADLVPVQFDGLLKLITTNAPANVIDLRGAAPTEDVINDALEQIRRNNGLATDLYFGTGPFADLVKQVQDRTRFQPGTGAETIGNQVKFFQGQHGKIAFHDHMFLAVNGTARTGGVGKAERRPLEPTISVQPAANADATALLPTGTYIYRVAAGNRYGISTPVTTSSVTPSGSENVTFTIANQGRATYYDIYRTEAGAAASTARLMTRVKVTGATQVFTDRNFDMPGKSHGFLLQQNDHSMRWAQLLGMTRVPLATVDTSIRWAQVTYGALKLYAPGKNIVFKNVGRTPGSITP